MKRIFISSCDTDQNKVHGMSLWLSGTNPDFTIDYCDESMRVAREDNDPTDIARCVREKVSCASVTVCLVSEATHASARVTSELEESIKQGNTIICMGFKGGPRSLMLPEPARRLKLPWYRWDMMALLQMIRTAPESVKRGSCPDSSAAPWQSIGTIAATSARWH